MLVGFRDRLHRRERLLGTMLTIGSPAVAELLAGLGFDWLFIDAEHAPFELGDIFATLQAVGDRSACLVRVGAAQELPIKQVLDLGATGIIAPQVNSAEHARQVVSWSRYSPVGARGVGIGRAHRYGLDFQGYIDQANDNVTVIVQVEHIDAVRDIENIVQVPGIDGVLIGPYDLSASLGKLGQVTDPEVLSAIQHVTTVCHDANIPLGVFGTSAAAVQPYLEQGFSLIVAGVDTVLLGQAAARMLNELREASGK